MVASDRRIDPHNGLWALVRDGGVGRPAGVFGTFGGPFLAKWVTSKSRPQAGTCWHKRAVYGRFVADWPARKPLVCKEKADQALSGRWFRGVFLGREDFVGFFGGVVDQDVGREWVGPPPAKS